MGGSSELAERNARGDPQLAVLHTLREHLFIVVVRELVFIYFYYSNHLCYQSANGTSIEHKMQRSHHRLQASDALPLIEKSIDSGPGLGR